MLVKMIQTKRNSPKIINNMIKKSIRNEKRRSFMIIVSIALSSFLICFIGVALLSIIQSKRNQVLDTYEAIYMNMSEKDIKELKNVSEFERIGTTYIWGEEKAENGYKGNFLYLDEPMLYMVRQQSSLIQGRLPNKYNEIAVSDMWIERYGRNAEIGDMITLKTENFQGEYIVTGILKTAYDNKNVYPFFISKERLQKVKNYNATSYLAYIHINNDVNAERIKDICNKVAEQNDFSLRFNAAYFEYTNKEISVEDIIVLIGAIGIVLFGSFIVIQSIFQISVIEKIQGYGQLRTIGMTRKQIKKMVKKEGIKLGFIGSGFGISIGLICSLIVFSKGLNSRAVFIVVLLDLIICYFAVLFSIRKPAKIASKVSPVEATRYVYKPKKSVNKRKNSRKITSLRLGVRNFGREKQRTMSIVISLSFGGILLLIISSMALIQKPEKMARRDFLNGDYRVYIDSDKELFDLLYEKNPLNEKLKKQILEIPGVINIETGRQTGHYRFDFQGIKSSGMCDMITKENRAAIEEAISEGKMPSGNEIIVMDGYQAFGKKPEVGMQLEISLGGIQMPVKISGIFEIGKISMAYGHGDKQLDAPMMYFPSELFEVLMPGISTFDYSWDITCEPSETKKVEAALQDIIANNTEIAMDSIFERCEIYRALNSPVYSVLQTMSWIVFLFGVINLINTTLSNQLSRQHENSILHSIGLTHIQLYKMVICEGSFYVFSSMLLVIGIGTPIAYLICRQVGKITYGEAVKYQFPFKQMVAYLLTLSLLELALSIWTIKRQRKKTIIEQIKNN